MKKAELISMFPPDDERYSPVPVGKRRVLDQNLDERRGVTSLFRGPLRIIGVDPVFDPTVWVSVGVNEDPETGEAWVTGSDLQDDDGRDFRLFPEFVGNPREDGSFLVVAGKAGTFVESTFLVRPLTMEDAPMLKVENVNSVEELAEQYPSYKFGR